MNQYKHLMTGLKRNSEFCFHEYEERVENPTCCGIFLTNKVFDNVSKQGIEYLIYCLN